MAGNRMPVAIHRSLDVNGVYGGFHFPKYLLCFITCGNIVAISSLCCLYYLSM